MRSPHLYILALLLSLLAVACSDYDSFTTDASCRLSFSRGEVQFDTILATVGSSTQTLYVFNPNNDGLRISEVRLAQGAASHFRVNVDGQFLADGVGEDFLVRRKDSIVVRLEVTLPMSGQTEPVSYSDELLFRLESGVVQRVTLMAGGQDAKFFHGLYVESDMTIDSPIPYVIYDSLVVAEAATLTLAAGTRLLFHDKCGMRVRGKLVAEGTLEKPVVLRGDRLDHMFDNLLYDNTPNRWEGLHFYPTSKGNKLTYTDLHSGCQGIHCEGTGADELALEMENCLLHNLGGDGLSLLQAKAVVTNTQVSNTKGNVVAVRGGNVLFLHCTLAQFYPFVADRGAALYISDLNADGEPVALVRADFVNCVISGYGDDVLTGNFNDLEGANFLFHHCHINTPAYDDPLGRFSNVVFDGKEQPTPREGNFSLFDVTNFIYDFTPVEASTIRGLADATYPGVPLLDRLGRDRLQDGAPDAGCYEFAAPTE